MMKQNNPHGAYQTQAQRRKFATRFTRACNPAHAAHAAHLAHLAHLTRVALVATALAPMLAGCATQPRQPDTAETRQPHTDATAATPAVQRVEAQPLVILVGKDKELGLEAYDDETLMQGGIEALNEYRLPRAILFFRRLVAEFPQSPRYPEALYRLGLTHGKLGEPDPARKYLTAYLTNYPDHDFAMPARVALGLVEAGDNQCNAAIEHFATVIARDPNTSDAVEARFYLGDCQIALNDWLAAKETFAALSIRGDLLMSAEVEAYVKLARAETELGELDEAERHVRHALTQYRANEQKEYLDKRLGAHAHYVQAEIERRRFLLVLLEYPEDLLAKRLQEKCERLLAAQSLYVRAIRMGDLQFAAASGYRVGSLYRELYDAIMQVPKPTVLTHEVEHEIYHEELLKKVNVLIRKAIMVYERTLDMAERTGLNGDWVEKTRESLDHMKSMYLANEDHLIEQRMKEEALREQESREARTAKDGRTSKEKKGHP